MNPMTKQPLPRPAANRGENERESATSAPAPGTFLEAGPIGLQAAARVPAGALTVDERDEDALLGAQLTAQWERVKANRRDDLIFGAMMLRLRAHCDSARGVAKKGNAERKGTGLKAWLSQHAPAVSESIAYRLMEIADGISADFNLKKIDLETLLAAQLDGLDEKLAKKRAQIEEVIEGKSQRQLLLEFGKGPDRRGDNPGGFRPNLTMLRGWLAQEYPEDAELGGWMDLQFFDLPEKVQERFRAEGKRYEERLTAAQKEELEAVALAQDWNAHAAQSLHDAQDALHYQRATDAQLAALETALADFLGEVRKTIRARAEKRPALRTR